MNKIKVALADDHVVLRKGLANLISNHGYTVQFECNNGKQLIDKLNKKDLPDIILMDISMPEMDGYETTFWLKQNYPSVNVLALSTYDDENAIIRMLRAGAKGYILKEVEPLELMTAINEVVKKGFYYSETVTGKFVHAVREMDENDFDSDKKPLLKLSEREIEFLKLVCTEMTYREIAHRMYLSPRTIDGYRDHLFDKLDAKSRVGLVLYAIKNGIVLFN